MFVIRFITKFGETLPPCQKNSAQIQQSEPGELGSRAANRSVNPELICPPYILWPRSVRAGSDPSSPEPRPVVARSQPLSFVARPVVARYLSSLPKQHPLLPNPVPVVARFFLNFHTHRRLLYTRRCELLTRRRALRTLCQALHTCRREVRDPSLRPFPHPPRTRPRQPYKYTCIFFSPHSVRASWPALAMATACRILHEVLTTFHRTSSTTTRI